ncbi:MAG: AraC family transcriptional regulator [Ruminococcus sp.]|nr:AraC family transcriptional regulator [Ruminococcus sp.]
MEFSHELIMPNQGLPFKVFLFEGGEGNYFRNKHWHRSVELFAVYEGNLEFYLNEQAYPLRTGEFILVNSNEIHSIDSPNPNRTIVLQIPLKTFEDYYTGEQYIRFTHTPRAKDGEVMRLIREIYASYEERMCGYEMKVKGLYYMLLYLLVTEYRETDVTPDMVKRNKKLNRLSLITNYIKENYASDLSLETLAEVFGYSPTYLSRMFQKYAGINYKSYLQSIRLERAFQELANTGHTISEVALDNGFPNSKALAKAFQKKYGILPSEYRKGIGKEKKL